MPVSSQKDHLHAHKMFTSLQRAQNLFDIAIGHDNIFHGERYKWSARLSGGQPDE